jgi:DMSO/TMAO reductase YedYZ molybdopterin-dependent catalytic subunit
MTPDGKRGTRSTPDERATAPAVADDEAAGDAGRVKRLVGRLVSLSDKDFTSAAHSEKATARIGVWLGIAFGICFVTGLLSHFVQRGPGWFYWPSTPVNLYRVTQGLHVLSGIAAVPLLFAKLWSVYPKLFGRPLVRSLPHAIERGSILLLSGAAFFELATGLFNSAQNYVWGFSFPPAHYAVAWIAIGSILVHVAVKLPVIRRALPRASEEPATERGALSRRAFLRTTWLATGTAVVATAGTSVPFLRDVSPLSMRTARGPQGLPVNKTAHAARISRVDDTWRLRIAGPGGTIELSRGELEDMATATEELPISCVEGWSQSAVWQGVRVADLLEIAGAEPGARVRVVSLDKGIYGRSTLPGSHSGDPKTLLALRLNGEPLALDHGYPCRLIAPNRPGVLQTKWVTRLEVL